MKGSGVHSSKECMSCDCVSFAPRSAQMPVVLCHRLSRIAKSDKEISKIGNKIRVLVGECRRHKLCLLCSLPICDVATILVGSATLLDFAFCRQGHVAVQHASRRRPAR